MTQRRARLVGVIALAVLSALVPAISFVSVEVTHYKPAGAAWGYLLVYFLVEGTTQTTARGTQVTRTATLRR